MSIVYAAVVPHAPLLLPTINKAHHDLLSATHHSLGQVTENLYAAQPDVVCIISPHGAALNTCCQINVADHYQGQLSEFGDIATSFYARGVPAYAHQMQNACEQAHVPLRLQTYDNLDYGCTVPLLTLLRPRSSLPIIPLLINQVALPEVLRAGTALREYLVTQTSRFALIASGDFSRRREGAPGIRRRPSADERRISSAITQVAPSDLLEASIDTAVCGLRPVLLLLAILQDWTAKGTILSFEAPFAVGQLVADFHPTA